MLISFSLQKAALSALNRRVITSALIVDVIAQRFPKLTRLAKKQLVIVADPELLRQVLVKVSVTQTAEEARQQLLALNEVDE